jgi:deoxycytidylate deaminase
MLTKSQRAYFRAARAVSELSDYPRHHLGCVIVDKHRIVSSGYNSNTKCDSIQAKMDIERHGVFCPGKVHAECAALMPILKNKISLSNAELYVYREHKNGSLAMSRPCPSCMKLIRKCGIRYINYTTEDGYAFETLEV